MRGEKDRTDIRAGLPFVLDLSEGVSETSYKVCFECVILLRFSLLPSICMGACVC